MKRIWLIFILLALCGCKSIGPRTVLKNHNSDIRDMIIAVKNLPKEEDSSKFWNSIANDESRNDKQRRLAVFQLLARHFRSGVTLSGFSKMLNNPTWFSDDEVRRVKTIAGGMPVGMNDEDVVFVLPVCAHHRTDSIPTLWVRVRGKIEEEEFNAVIRGNEKNQRIEDIPVVQVGSNEWHDDGYSIENAFGMNPDTYKR